MNVQYKLKWSPFFWCYIIPSAEANETLYMMEPGKFAKTLNCMFQLT